MTIYAPIYSALQPLWDCGHPRTGENTQKVGKAGFRCRECRREIGREHMRRKSGYYSRRGVSQ